MVYYNIYIFVIITNGLIKNFSFKGGAIVS